MIYPALPFPALQSLKGKEHLMNNFIWLVGAVVIVLFILGYFGLR